MHSPRQVPLSGPAVSSHDRILHAAKQLFAERGYENTSTVAIARQAGTSESQLMKHFGSKEGLLEAIFEQGWERMGYELGRVQEVSSPAEKLAALLDLVLSSLERDPQLKELMLLEGRRVRKEGRAILMTGGYQNFVKVIDAVLAELKSAGQLRPEVQPDAVRSGLMGMFEGMLRDQVLAQRMGYPAKYNSADLRKVFTVVLGALLQK